MTQSISISNMFEQRWWSSESEKSNVRALGHGSANTMPTDSVCMHQKVDWSCIIRVPPIKRSKE